mmetsp:Transcript_2182/g.14478  ORF Transcript_2182/g.14478 Transcript_2182/m.14478 type:complete len:93 (-) Transcript_2182:3163-3441(-)
MQGPQPFDMPVAFEAILGVLDGARLAPRRLCASATPRYTWQTMERQLNWSTTAAWKGEWMVGIEPWDHGPTNRVGWGVHVDLRVSERPVAGG